MSALDDARTAATAALLEAGREDYTVPAYVLADAAVDAFLVHLANNPPDEALVAMVDRERDPNGPLAGYCDLLSAALRSITTEKASI